MFSNQDSWITIDPKEEYGIDLNKPDTIRSYFSLIDTNQKFGKLIAFQLGNEPFTREGVLANFLTKVYYDANKDYSAKFLCSMQYYSDFKDQ